MERRKESGKIENQEMATKRLIDSGLRLVAQRYGVGVGEEQKVERRNLKYHNHIHTMDVVAAVEELSELALKSGKINKDEAMLLKIAAAWHDSEQDIPKDNQESSNESVSADEAAAAMEQTGAFNREQIQKVRNYILATRTKFENGKMSQLVDETDYGQKILADADLMNLGDEVYEDRAERLRLEFGQDKEKFWSSQEGFIRNHTYFTGEARQLFSSKELNIARAKAKLAA